MRRALLAAMLVTMSVSAQRINRPIYFNFDSGGFSATGKWVPADPKDKAAFPSETEIDCTKSEMSCVEATAEYYYGHPHVTVAEFQVVKWDVHGIIAASASGVCMTNTMLISFAEKSISETDSMKQLDDKTKVACNSIGAKKTEMSLFILKGSERWNKEQ
jgi:hypothetical protein